MLKERSVNRRQDPRRDHLVPAHRLRGRADHPELRVALRRDPRAGEGPEERHSGEAAQGGEHGIAGIRLGGSVARRVCWPVAGGARHPSALSFAIHRRPVQGELLAATSEHPTLVAPFSCAWPFASLSFMGDDKKKRSPRSHPFGCSASGVCSLSAQQNASFPRSLCALQ